MLNIDAHAHYAGDRPRTIEWMDQADVKILNICVGGEGQEWRQQAERYGPLARAHPDRYAWCTSFSLPGFDDPHYAEKVIAQLQEDVAAGAIACKAWKAIGMDLKRPDGQFVMIDDPIFEPIFAHLEQVDVPLIMHMAEPMDCWRPLDENNRFYRYYSKHPEWHMYGRDDVPHHSEIMAARDRAVERHPRLTVIGAHFGCMEYDVDEIAKRLDAYPNFAVDTSGPSRMTNLAAQDHGKVRAFFIKYQDRILYGSDAGTENKLQSQMTEEEAEGSLRLLKDIFQVGWDYYRTDKQFQIKGWDVHGLALPEEVREKLFLTNARRWIPGL